MVNALDCEIVASEFEFKSRDEFQFRSQQL